MTALLDMPASRFQLEGVHHGIAAAAALLQGFKSEHSSSDAAPVQSLVSLWEGIEEGSSITHQKSPLVLPLLSQKHIQSHLLLGTPSLIKVVPLGKMLCEVNK